MTNASLDQNNVATKLGVLFSDGVTLVPIAINPSTGRVRTNSTDTLSVPAGTIALSDENRKRVLMGINSVDGTPIPVYVDTEGKVLIET